MERYKLVTEKRPTSIRLLAVLLIIDYSGSMYQPFDNKPKYVIMKEHISALATVQASEESVNLKVFGSNPKAGCKDILNYKSSFAALPKQMNLLIPGDNGKTPLAKVIQEIKPQQSKSQKYSQNKSLGDKKVILLTDGSDTCGEDPCEALIALDKSLGAGEKVSLDLIGYDLKESGEKLACFKKLALDSKNGKLKHIDFHFIDIQNPDDFTSYLSSLSNEIQNLTLGKNKQKAILKIADAPPTAEFELIPLPSPSKLKKSGATSEIENGRKWKGEYSLRVSHARYQLRYLSENGKTIEVILKENESRSIPFSSLLKNVHRSFVIDPGIFEIEIVPSPAIKKIFKDAKSSVISVAGKINLYIGEWSYKIVTPKWLEKLPPKKISVDLPVKAERLSDSDKENPLSLNIEESFKDSIAWVEVPKVNDEQIAIIASQDETTHKVILLPMNDRLPISKESSVKFIKDQQ